MSAHLAYLRFALSQRLWAPALGLAGGLLALILPWLPGHHLGRLESWEAATPVLVIIGTIAVAALLGITAATEDRQAASYMLGRPLRAPVVAALRLGLDFALWIAAAVLVAAPAHLARLATGHGGPVLLYLPDGVGGVLLMSDTALIWLVPLLVRLGAELAAAAALDRSLVLLLDALVMVAIVVLLQFTAAAVPWWAAATSVGLAAILFLFAALTIAFGLACLFRLSRGRGDHRTAHRVGATTVLVTLVPAAIVLGGWTRYLHQPVVVSDIDEVVAVGSIGLPGAAMVLGHTPMRFDLLAVALLDLASGKPTPTLDWAFPSPTTDGVAIGVRSLSAAELEVGLLRRGGSGITFEPTGVTLDHPRWAGSSLTLAVSNDGRRLAHLSGEQLELSEVPSGRLLGVFHVPRSLSMRRLYFDGHRPTVARLIEVNDGPGLMVESFDPNQESRQTMLSTPGGDRTTLQIIGDRLVVAGEHEVVGTTLDGTLVCRRRLADRRHRRAGSDLARALRRRRHQPRDHTDARPDLRLGRRAHPDRALAAECRCVPHRRRWSHPRAAGARHLALRRLPVPAGTRAWCRGPARKRHRPVRAVVSVRASPDLFVGARR
jgi:hypothetical protein